jgi:hypothetical protein
MGEFSPFYWLIVLGVVVFILVSAPFFAYWHGKKVGNQAGYIRGYKEGQQSVKG